ncbi:MAG: isoprenylcysteine carboxylmethyltransferase family protein [Mesorhizobium sp.]|nr:protein-S-isoprenylcysteine O-methyltransferase [Mesorhizobium sp.]MBL8577838.1 isoprenylcysteine carboxylmethyltransferase family protein [Mesorhizobium sp.]
MTATFAAIVWTLGLVAWFVIRLPYQRRARRIGISATQRTLTDRLALAASGIGLAVIPAFYLATGIPAAADYPFQPLLGWCGLLVQVLFLALFYASHRQLGRNWSVSLEIRNDHRLVTDGLYRYVRHPMYSSFWLWAIAQAFLLPNWVAGLSGLVGVGILFLARVGAEEAMMEKHFGEQYRSYAARTGRVIPRIF